MAGEGCIVRALRALERTALRLREPAVRLTGSLRAAVGLLAAVVGGYSLVIACIYIRHVWQYFTAYILVLTTGSFAYITVIMNMVLFSSILLKKDVVLRYAICAAISLYTICMPLSFSVIIGTLIDGWSQQVLMEPPRIAMCLLHLGLMYCLLVELDSSAEVPTPPSPPPSEGWLKNGLAHRATPPLSGEEVLLKVDGGRTHPTFFAPAAAPVHQPPASYGPLSSSEA